MHWIITILTLGILWPRKTFYLEKFRTDRTVYGSAALHQGGTWTMLMLPFIPVMVGAALSFAVTGAVSSGYVTPAESIIGFVVALPCLIAGLIHYNVQATRLLAIHKSAGALGLKSEPRTSVVLRIYVFGYIATTILVALPLLSILMVVGMVESAKLSAQWDPSFVEGMVYGIPLWAWTVLGAFAYFAVFLMWGVLRHCYVTMPLWRHFAQTLTITNETALNDISQKERDEFQEAEGFAEALDLGAAI
jgi:hypothetical protein